MGIASGGSLEQKKPDFYAMVKSEIKFKIVIYNKRIVTSLSVFLPRKNKMK